MQEKKMTKGISELVKGGSITLLIKILGMGLGYCAMLFVTNVYGAAQWGLYTLCVTVLSIAVLIPKFGFDNSLVRIITELKLYDSNKEIRSVLYKSITISFLFALLVIVIMNLFSDYIVFELLKKPELQPYMSILSFAILPITLIAIISAYFQALKKTVLFILFQTAFINIVFLALLLFNYFFEVEPTVIKVYITAVILTLIAAVLFYVSINTEGLEVSASDKKEIKYSYNRIINISTPMLLSSSFALFMGWSDIIMLSIYKSTTDIGIYDSALRLATLSGITLIAINAVVTPKFVEFYSKNDLIGLKNIVQKSTRLIFFTATPILLILVGFAKDILSLFGDEFAIGYIALIYLCISRFINAISGSVGYIMQMTDNQRTYQFVILIAFIINVILNLILIPKYSFTGAALASSVAMIFWNLTLVFIIKRRLGFWTVITFKFKKN